MLRDHLICGVNHERIQRHLLSEKDLMYKKAHEIAITLEAAAKGSKNISTTTTQPIELIVNYTKGIRGRTTHPQAAKPPDGPQSKLTCYRCGEAHLQHPSASFVQQSVTNVTRRDTSQRCASPGQIESLLTIVPKGLTATWRRFQTSQIQRILRTDCSPCKAKLMIQLWNSSVPTRMELDTGASLILISKASYNLIAQPGQASLEQPMKTYTGEAVKMLGSTTVKVKYGEQCTHLIVHVVDGKGPNLLGRNLTLTNQQIFTSQWHQQNQICCSTNMLYYVRKGLVS